MSLSLNESLGAFELCTTTSTGSLQCSNCNIVLFADSLRTSELHEV